ncbi:hypothetical protein IWQ61_007672 [Dispira simplex]|nr:hypothetical protein IWQ61_007672 [Dispira simplex]
MSSEQQVATPLVSPLVLPSTTEQECLSDNITTTVGHTAWLVDSLHVGGGPLGELPVLALDTLPMTDLTAHEPETLLGILGALPQTPSSAEQAQMTTPGSLGSPGSVSKLPQLLPKPTETCSTKAAGQVCIGEKRPAEDISDTVSSRPVTPSPSQTLITSTCTETKNKRARKILSPEEVLAKKRERSRRNRDAAQLSRERRRQFVEQLETRNQELERENTELRTRVSAVEQRNQLLLSRLDELSRQVARLSQRDWVDHIVLNTDEAVTKSTSSHQPSLDLGIAGSANPVVTDGLLTTPSAVVESTAEEQLVQPLAAVPGRVNGQDNSASHSSSHSTGFGESAVLDKSGSDRTPVTSDSRQQRPVEMEERVTTGLPCSLTHPNSYQQLPRCEEPLHQPSPAIYFLMAATVPNLASLSRPSASLSMVMAPTCHPWATLALQYVLSWMPFLIAYQITTQAMSLALTVLGGSLTQVPNTLWQKFPPSMVLNYLLLRSMARVMMGRWVFHLLRLRPLWRLHRSPRFRSLRVRDPVGYYRVLRHHMDRLMRGQDSQTVNGGTQPGASTVSSYRHKFSNGQRGHQARRVELCASTTAGNTSQGERRRVHHSRVVHAPLFHPYRLANSMMLKSSRPEPLPTSSGYHDWPLTYDSTPNEGSETGQETGILPMGEPQTRPNNIDSTTWWMGNAISNQASPTATRSPVAVAKTPWRFTSS